MPDIPEDVKRQATDVVAAMQVEIQMSKQAGGVFPTNTPNPELAEKVGRKLDDMQRLGYDVDELNKELTKDDFVRE